MAPRDWYEKAEDELVRQYNDGEIDDATYRAEMRELQRDYAAMREQAAEEAAEAERERW